MPPLTRLFIKTAFAYLVIALLAALFLTASPFVKLPPVIAMLNPVYYHLFLVGWITQLIIGVAYWMFPRFTPSQPRGFAQLAWVTYLFLNLGLILRVVAEPANAVQPGPVWGWLLAVAAWCQGLGGLALVLNTWPRIKEK
jgi:hypothetical protein